MRYNGGKSVVGKRFAEVINLWGKDKHTYVEPFVGSAWVTIHIDHPHRLCFDANGHLIALWKALQGGWIPPEEVTEKEYHEAKDIKINSAFKAFVGFGCSWGGKWFGGYAPNAGNPEAARQSRDSLLRKAEKVEGVIFGHCDYRFLYPKECIVYCDPPYADSTEAWGLVDPFDHDEFWEKMREWTKEDNTIIISSYTAPEDFTCIADFDNVKVVSGNRGGEKVRSRTEKLWLAP